MTGTVSRTSPEFAELVAWLRARPFRADETPVAELRAGFERFAAEFHNPPAVRRTAADLGGVAVEWARSESPAEAAAVLYLHGGGYCIGSVPSYRDITARLAAATGIAVATVDYRLAPEHPFPAAVDDALAAYRALLGSGVPAARVGVCGDSAGGGLSVSLALAARDAGLPVPGAIAAFSPLADLAHAGSSVAHNATLDPLVTPEGSHRYAVRYLGGEDEALMRHPLASPVYADLHGLPPVHIQVGTAEVLLDDSLRLARGIRAAGGRVDLDVWPDMVHILPFFAAKVPEAREALDGAVAFLRTTLLGRA